jgi:hypothetical protein
VQDRERWLEMFAAADFGSGALRLWIWERDEPIPVPDRVIHDPSRVLRWQPGSMAAPERRRRGPVERLRHRIDLRDRADVWLGRLRRRRNHREGV